MQQINHELELELARVKQRGLEREYELEREMTRQRMIASRVASRERFSF